MSLMVRQLQKPLSPTVVRNIQPTSTATMPSILSQPMSRFFSPPLVLPEVVRKQTPPYTSVVTTDVAIISRLYHNRLARHIGIDSTQKSVSNARTSSSGQILCAINPYHSFRPHVTTMCRRMSYVTPLPAIQVCLRANAPHVSLFRKTPIPRLKVRDKHGSMH
jgi:hypothetical protein